MCITKAKIHKLGTFHSCINKPCQLEMTAYITGVSRSKSNCSMLRRMLLPLLGFMVSVHFRSTCLVTNLSKKYMWFLWRTTMPQIKARQPTGRPKLQHPTFSRVAEESSNGFLAAECCQHFFGGELPQLQHQTGGEGTQIPSWGVLIQIFHGQHPQWTFAWHQVLTCSDGNPIWQKPPKWPSSIQREKEFYTFKVLSSKKNRTNNTITRPNTVTIATVDFLSMLIGYPLLQGFGKPRQMSYLPFQMYPLYSMVSP